MIIPFNKQTNFLSLIKSKKKFLEEFNTEKSYKSEKKRTKQFVDSFNKEAKKQKSEWYAETEECKSICDRKPFILTHLCKEKISGWWIFKEVDIVKLHIVVYENHTSFVENDYVIVDSDIKGNNRVFYYLPEFISILEKIPEAFFILPKEEIYNFEKRFSEIKKRVEILEDTLLNNKILK